MRTLKPNPIPVLTPFIPSPITEEARVAAATKGDTTSAVPNAVYSSLRPLTKNKHLLNWIQKIAALTLPHSIHWVDGSQEEYEALCAQMVAGGTFIN